MIGSDGIGRSEDRPYATAQRCFLCSKRRDRAAWCEQWDRVAEFLQGREPGRLIWAEPKDMYMCKDCCIGALEGHRCIWWDLCWRR
jgi:hypothetical protein